VILLGLQGNDLYLSNLAAFFYPFISVPLDYNREPGKAALLTGLIVYLIYLVSLPINPAIATIIVLWVLKLGIHTFCDYTEPDHGLEDSP
jgi:hypothetical protein